jgi:hypothetical protein
MENPPVEVSVTAPVSPAIERMKQILFRPFDFGKWITIGFCAWLAYLGTMGYNYGQTTSSNRSSHSTSLEHARAYVAANLTWIIPVAIVCVLIFIALCVLILWLQSRGIFMLLHCVALNRGEVVAPWHKYAREARSLWLFKLCLLAAGLVFVTPLVGAMFWVFSAPFRTGARLPPAAFAVLSVMVLIWICVAVPLGVVSGLTRQFAATIMYLRGVTCLEAWGVLLPIVHANAGRFILYLLFEIVIAIATFLILFVFVLCTCCIGGILLAIPFVGSVVLLPVTIFWRCYSILYFAQYGPELNVFAATAAQPQAPPPLLS